MISYDPQQRITIREIEKNSWYRQTEEKNEAIELFDIMREKYKEAQINKKKKKKHADGSDDIIDQKKTLATFESCLSQFGNGITRTKDATLTPIDELKQMNTDDKQNENSLNPKGSASKRSSKRPSLLQSIQEHLTGNTVSKLSSYLASHMTSQLSSQVTSTIAPTDSLNCYRISNPLVIMVGIGDYDDELQNLIGITKDYKNVFYTFNNVYNYSLFYQTKDNKKIYIKNNILDLKKEHLSKKLKIKWDYDEIIDFFTKARKIIESNKHDSLIAIISSHGDSDGDI